MIEAGLIFLGLCLVLAAFVLVSVKLLQEQRQFVLKVLKYGLILFFGVCFSIAAVTIGLRIQDRHESTYSRGLKSVNEIWGGSVVQPSPAFFTEATVEEQYEDEETGEYHTRLKKVENSVGFALQDIECRISKNIRKKGLLYYAGYSYAFSGTYRVANSTEEKGAYKFRFSLPSGAGNLTAIDVMMDGSRYRGDTNFADGVQWAGELEPGEEHTFVISYEGQGTASFSYSFGGNPVSIDSLVCRMKADFGDIRIPDGAMVPSEHNSDDDLSVYTWKLANLVSRQDISLTFELEENHGSLVSKMFFYSPLTMMLFIAYLLILSVALGIRLHPMHFLFLITGFFIFYLFFSYVVSYMPVLYALPLSGAISSVIVGYYSLLLKKGKNFALSVVGGLVIFQWIFSVAFFFPEHTGFIITIASIVSFVILIRATAHVDWDNKW